MKIRLESSYPGCVDVMVMSGRELLMAIHGAVVEDLDCGKVQAYVDGVDWCDRGAKGWVVPDLVCDGFLRTDVKPGLLVLEL